MPSLSSRLRTLAVATFGQHGAKRPIGEVAKRYEAACEIPLIVRVVVQADHVDKLRLAAKLRRSKAKQHLERFELRQARFLCR